MSKTKMYSVLDKWTDLEKENIVDFTSVDGVVTEARLNGVPVGGGGGGAATITFTADSEFTFLDIYIYASNESSAGSMNLNNIPGVAIPVPASNADFAVVIEKVLVASITGDYTEATIDSTDYYKITGSVTVKIVD